MKIKIFNLYVLISIITSCSNRKHEENCNTEIIQEVDTVDGFKRILEFKNINGEKTLDSQWLTNSRGRFINESFGVEILNKQDTISIKSSNKVQFSVHPHFKDFNKIYLLIPKGNIKKLDCQYTDYEKYEYDTIKSLYNRGMPNIEFSNLTIQLKVYFATKGKNIIRGIINEESSKNTDNVIEVWQYFIELEYNVID